MENITARRFTAGVLYALLFVAANVSARGEDFGDVPGTAGRLLKNRGDAAPSASFRSLCKRVAVAAQPPYRATRIVQQVAASPKLSSVQKSRATGIFCLPSGDTVENPYLDLAGNSCWTSPNVSGLALRSCWDKMEPAKGSFDWTFFDQAITLAKKYHKKLSFSVDAGADTPAWVYQEGATALSYNNNSNTPIKEPFPWNPVFLREWMTFVRAFAHRYDASPQLAYVTVGGPGRRDETVYADTPESIALFNARAPGGLGDEAWLAASEKIIAQYAASFQKTPFIIAMSPPTSDANGAAAIANLVSNSSSLYGTRFGVRSDALLGDYPANSFASQTIATFTAAGAPAGFQMFLPFFHGQVAGTLAQALNTGMRLEAQFIEVYYADCADPSQASVIQAANAQLLQTYGQ